MELNTTVEQDVIALIDKAIELNWNISVPKFKAIMLSYITIARAEGKANILAEQLLEAKLSPRPTELDVHFNNERSNILEQMHNIFKPIK
jgi:hypothetical protein